MGSCLFQVNGGPGVGALWRVSVLLSLCHLCSSVPLHGVRQGGGEVKSEPHFGSPSFLSGSRQPLLLSGSLQFPEFLPEQIPLLLMSSHHPSCCIQQPTTSWKGKQTACHDVPGVPSVGCDVLAHGSWSEGFPLLLQGTVLRPSLTFTQWALHRPTA